MIKERLMTRVDIQNYTKLDDLERQREEFVAILNTRLASITNTLSMSQISLSQALDSLSQSSPK
jgi:hypothetical protein